MARAPSAPVALGALATRAGPAAWAGAMQHARGLEGGVVVVPAWVVVALGAFVVAVAAVSLGLMWKHRRPDDPRV